MVDELIRNLGVGPMYVVGIGNDWFSIQGNGYTAYGIAMAMIKDGYEVVTLGEHRYSATKGENFLEIYRDREGEIVVCVYEK